MSRRLQIYMFSAFLAIFSIGFVAGMPVLADGDRIGIPDHSMYLPNDVNQDRLAFSWHVGKLITNTEWCIEEGISPQIYYLEMNGKKVPVGIPQGPFQAEISGYVGDSIGMWGIEGEYCDTLQLHKFWWALVQSEKLPFPPGDEVVVIGKLKYDRHSLGEFMLTQCDGSESQPIYLIVEHNSALRNRMMELDGKLVSLSVVETEGLMSRTRWKDRQTYLWVFDILFDLECNEPPTATPTPTQSKRVSPPPPPTRVIMKKMYLPFLAAPFLPDPREFTPEPD